MNGPTERAALHEAVLWHDRCREAEARVVVLEQQIAAAAELHRPLKGDYRNGYRTVCSTCSVQRSEPYYNEVRSWREAADWPCPTVLAAGVVDNPTEPGACMCGRRIEEHVGPFGTQCPTDPGSPS